MKNLIIRTITGIGFVALIVAAILLSDNEALGIKFSLLPYFFLVFTCVALYEYRTLLKKQKINLSVLFYAISLLIYLIASIPRNVWEIFLIYLVLPVLFLFFLLFIVELFRKQENPFTNIAYSILGIIWIVLPFALINRFPLLLKWKIGGDDGRFLLLSVFIIIWLYDTFAYCVGMLIGKHRLFERISPKKSWEGAIGSTILTLILAYFANLLFPMLPLNPLQWIGLALVIIVFGTLGDLAESLFKRQLSVKDSGTILPGHGGVLDRFDSILFAVPFVWIYLNLVL
ncbi:MAG: phosphatidate cytidylyltransferase [Lentimicrobiaceae bacterium]|nr:phosphatidate cytidylyltransferase [Lentimicrobiaceae bacterium]